VILVAVGTTDFGALVQAMDELSLSIAEEVVMQIGRSSYVPSHCEFYRFVPSLAPYYERASVIVSHGGLGIVTEVMRARRPLIAVEDPNQPGRHQREVLREWDRDGHLIWCKDLAALPEAIAEARVRKFRPYATPVCQIHLRIAEYLRDLA
jgi:UDP-N-acetylglucosamine transferase subunit ALG13